LFCTETEKGRRPASLFLLFAVLFGIGMFLHCFNQAYFGASGARLPAFPTAHFAEIAKLALSGLRQGNFYAPPGNEYFRMNTARF
jgi:hypothetical protein